MSSLPSPLSLHTAEHTVDLTENIDEFYKNGYTVIENFYNDDEINYFRSGLHTELLKHGIDHYKILTGEQKIDDEKCGPRIKSVTADFYYAKYQIDALINEKIYNVMKTFVNATFGTNKGIFAHPFGHSDDVIPFFDRICWRLPDHIRREDGLDLHLDQNPVDPYLLKGEGLMKWRPIQAFICLTDHWDNESGNLEVVSGFHAYKDDYFKMDYDELIKLESKGEFYRMNSKKYDALRDKLQPVIASKGSIVLWDNRLPHATSKLFNKMDSREVLYGGFILPSVKINQEYNKKQLINLSKNEFPPYYQIKLTDKKQKCNRDWNYSDLSVFQRKILSISK